MSKLQQFRNKMFFTDKKMESLAELTQEGEVVANSLQLLVDSLETLIDSIKTTSMLIDSAVNVSSVAMTKDKEKELKELLKKIKGDKTIEVLLASGEVVEKFNESL